MQSFFVEKSANLLKHEGKKPSRCPDCYKKFKQKNPSICEFYKAGHCMFGPKGQNKLGKCYKRHPEVCKNDDGCMEKNCGLEKTLCCHVTHRAFKYLPYAYIRKSLPLYPGCWRVCLRWLLVRHKEMDGRSIRTTTAAAAAKRP